MRYFSWQSARVPVQRLLRLEHDILNKLQLTNRSDGCRAKVKGSLKSPHIFWLGVSKVSFHKLVHLRKHFNKI